MTVLPVGHHGPSRGARSPAGREAEGQVLPHPRLTAIRGRDDCGSMRARSATRYNAINHGDVLHPVAGHRPAKSSAFIGGQRSLSPAGALRICNLDASRRWHLVASIIIFPACFAFAVEGQTASTRDSYSSHCSSDVHESPPGNSCGAARAVLRVRQLRRAVHHLIAVFKTSSSSRIRWTNGIGRKAAVPCACHRDGTQPAMRPPSSTCWRACRFPAIGDIQSLEDFIVIEQPAARWAACSTCCSVT